MKFAVLRLRRKFGWHDAARSPIRSVRGYGYRYDTPAGAPAPESAHAHRILQLLDRRDDGRLRG